MTCMEARKNKLKMVANYMYLLFLKLSDYSYSYMGWGKKNMTGGPKDKKKYILNKLFAEGEVNIDE